MEATNHDPRFELPGFYLPKDKPMKFVLDLDCPKKTEFQVFYSTKKDKSYSGEESIIRPLKKGRNKLSIVLPGKQYTRRFRIDPGRVQGKYLIRSIQVIVTD